MSGEPSSASNVPAAARHEPSVYDSARRKPRWIEEAQDLWRYRGLVHELVVRDIKVRYKRSVLGILWTMLAPLLNMVALTLVFSALLKTAIQNYPVYFMTGSIFWIFFSQTSMTRRPEHPRLQRARQTDVHPALGVHRLGPRRGPRQPAALDRAPAPDPRRHRVSALRDLGVPAGPDLHRIALHGGRLADPLHGRVALCGHQGDVPGHRPDVVLPHADRLPPVHRARARPIHPVA